MVDIHLSILHIIINHVVAVGTQFRFNNTVLQMLPEGSTASLNKTLVPDSSLIGLYLGSTDLTFDDDINEEAPVKVYFHHDSLDSYYEVGHGSWSCARDFGQKNILMSGSLC